MLKSDRGLFRHYVNKNGRSGWQGHVFSSNETCRGCFNREVNNWAYNDDGALLLNEAKHGEDESHRRVDLQRRQHDRPVVDEVAECPVQVVPLRWMSVGHWFWITWMQGSSIRKVFFCYLANPRATFRFVLFARRRLIFSHHLLPRPGFKPTSVEFHRPGTFWRMLYRLSYRAEAHF